MSAVGTPAALPTQLQGTLQLRLGLLVQPQLAVDGAHRAEQARLRQRLPGQFTPDALAAGVEDLARGDRVAARLVGIGDLEQPDQEARHLPRGLGFHARAPLGVDGADHAGGRAGDPEQDGGQRHGACRDTGAVAAHELPHAIACRRRPGIDRLVLQVPPYIVGQGAGRGIATLAVLLERHHRDPVEVAAERAHHQPRFAGAAARHLLEQFGRVARDGRHARARLRRLHLADDLQHLEEIQRCEVLAPERTLSDEQFVEHHAQGIDVCPRIEAFAGQPRLFGTHVFGRADELAGAGAQRVVELCAVERLGHAEVDDLGHRLAVRLGHQDVRRLEVAVDDRLLVRVLDTLADMDEQFEPPAQAHLLLVAVDVERHALDVLHHEVRTALVGRAGVEHLGDGRVVHHRQSLALGTEAGDELGGVHAALDHLQGDAATDRFLLVRFPDQAHASLADAALQEVRADELPLGNGIGAGGGRQGGAAGHPGGGPGPRA
jgi:hypothetical protein